MEIIEGPERDNQFDLFLQLALLTSLMNGKVFMEWVSPAMLKAYQWQVSIGLFT